jgi:hypothetical protein
MRNAAEVDQVSVRRTSDNDFKLDSTLDVPRLKTAFQRKGRLLIPRILQTSDAQRLYEHLSRDLDWGVTFAGDGTHRYFLSPGQYKELDAAQEREVVAIAYESRGSDGSHLFASRQVDGDTHTRASDHSLLARFVDFLNSSEFLDFSRYITGIDDLRSVSAAASCYRPGYFYAFHKDYTNSAQHLASFVFNLSPKWKHEWGGLLQFKDSEGCLEEAYLPRFNSLSMFLTSHEHAVSIVSPCAAAPRYAVGGRLLV